MKFMRIAIMLILVGAGIGPAATTSAAGGSHQACSHRGVTVIHCPAQYQASASVNPVGLGPNQLHAAYNVPTTGATTMVAVVTAYNDPQIKSDLDTYDLAFGLAPFPNCTSAAQTTCFERVDQRGGQSYGVSDSGWATETALDVETIHQICPTCRLELVQADTASYASLLAAVDRAVALGSKVVSMSWGGSEGFNETSYDAHFRVPGVSFFASSGDSGYGVSYPAASSSVIAVGGTTLTFSNGVAYETAWSGTGSGCSRYEAKPIWQKDTGCARRTVVDVSADANPASGAAVYTSTSPSGAGWLQVGGTSLSAPLVAGMAGLAGTFSAKTLYTNLKSANLSDVTRGSNGRCFVRYLCTAGAGYDGPTGVGTPRGLGAL